MPYNKYKIFIWFRLDEEDPELRLMYRKMDRNYVLMMIHDGFYFYYYPRYIKTHIITMRMFRRDCKNAIKRFYINNFFTGHMRRALQSRVHHRFIKSSSQPS